MLDEIRGDLGLRLIFAHYWYIPLSILSRFSTWLERNTSYFWSCLNNHHCFTSPSQVFLAPAWGCFLICICWSFSAKDSRRTLYRSLVLSECISLLSNFSLLEFNSPVSSIRGTTKFCLGSLPALQPGNLVARAFIKLTSFVFLFWDYCPEMPVLCVWNLLFILSTFQLFKQAEDKSGPVTSPWPEVRVLMYLLCISYMPFFSMIFQCFSFFDYLLIPIKSSEFSLDKAHLWSFPWPPLIEIIAPFSVFQIPLVSGTFVYST